MKPVDRTYDGWIGLDAFDADGDKVGEIADIYYDDATGRRSGWRSRPVCSG